MFLEIKSTNKKNVGELTYPYARFMLLRIMLYKLIILNFHYVILHVCFQNHVYFYFPTMLLVYLFSALHYSHNKVSNLL